MKESKNKVLVIGSAGMAGHLIMDYFSNNTDFEVFGVARKEAYTVTHIVDLTNLEELAFILGECKPQYVINCAGKLVGDSMKDPEGALFINGYLPHFLASQGASLGFKLIHLSTDCVFSGKEGNYSEAALPDGDTPYALTKATGEIFNANDLTVRTSIIGPDLSPKGSGLFNWFLSEQNVVRGYSRTLWSGVTTLELAKGLHAMIRQNISGLFHFCPDSKISKYDLITMISNVWGTSHEIIPDASKVSDKSLRCTRKDFSYPVISYESMLLDLKAWTDKRSRIYNPKR